MTAARVEALLNAASIVDVLDVAGRIIANPARFAPTASTAQTLALAHAVERLWSLSLIAHQLVVATAAEPIEAERCASLTKAFENEMAAIRGEIPSQE